MYRTDKYKVGDRVFFDRNYHAFKDVAIAIDYLGNGNGPYRVYSVTNVPYEQDQYGSRYCLNQQSNWSSMGHTQHICIERIDKTASSAPISGAFFIPLEDQRPSLGDILSEALKQKETTRMQVFTINVDNLTHLVRVVAEAYPGEKISAIKKLRECTGLGLKESKDLIEASYQHLDPVKAYIKNNL